MNNEHNIDMGIVRNNPHESWDKSSLSMNEQLTVKDIDTLIFPNGINDWDWENISQYINIQEVRNNPDKPWDKYWLSDNSGLTLDDIDNLILPKSIGIWDWNGITLYVNIQEVINNPNKPWDKYGLMNNKQCTPKILEFFNAGLLKHLQMNIPKFQYHTDMIVKCEY